MSAGPASNCNSTAQGPGSPWLYVRREPFTYGLLPLHSLMHAEGVLAFRSLRTKLLERAVACQNWPLLNNTPTPSASLTSCPVPANQPPQKRISTAGIAGSLGLPEAHAHLVLDTLASVLPDDDGREVDPLARAAASEVDAVGADVDQLLLFLYIQSYRRVPPRPHRDAATVADVWPSNSVFDGLLPSLCPIQTRPAQHPRRWMPGQAEEEAHQLCFLQKHLPSMLALLAESEDGEVEGRVITADKFRHLGFLLQARDAGLDVLPLSEAAPFFANSDPDMPAAPVPVGQVLDWILRHLCSPSVHVKDKLLTKENGLVEAGTSESDVAMVDACSISTGAQTTTHSGGIMKDSFQLWKEPRLGGFAVVEGVTRASFLKEEADLNGDAAIVSHCHDSVIYLLAPLKYASVFGCSDSIIILGATGKAVRVEHCERVQLIVPCARICIANCRECLFHLGVNQRPLVLGDNHNLQVAPYNTFYPSLEAHLAQVGVDPTVNRWDRVLTLGVVDPHDSVSHPAGIADAQAEGASLLQPDRFLNFMVPRWCDVDSERQLLTRANPFLLPKPYLLSQQHRAKSVESLRQALRSVPLDDIKKRDLSNVLHSYFREWLYASGSIRQIYDLQILDKDVKALD